MLGFLSVLSFLFVRQLRRSGEGDEDKDDKRERKKDKQQREEEVTVTSQLTSAHPQKR